MTQEFKIKPLTKKLQRFLKAKSKVLFAFKQADIKYIVADSSAYNKEGHLLRLSGYSSIPELLYKQPDQPGWKYPMWSFSGFEIFFTEDEHSPELLELKLVPRVIYEVTPEIRKDLLGGADE